MRSILTSALVVASVVFTSWNAAMATVINAAYWRGGENDVSPGPTGSFGVADATTIDASGNGNNLTGYNDGTPGPYYVYTPSPLPSGSTVAYGFNPASSNMYYRNGPVTTATQNWGIQAWVIGTANSDTRIYMENGSGSVGNGYALLQYNGTFQGLLEGVNFLDSGIAPDGKWHNLALVNDSGVTTFYVDCVAKATLNASANAPTTYTTLGGELSGSGAAVNLTANNIDEARVFTFASGAFQTSDLSNYAVPEPSSILLSLCGIVGIIVYRWRKKR